MPRALTLAMSVSAVGVALASYRFVFLGWEPAFFTVTALHAPPRQAFLAAHIVLAPIALVAGAFQFFPGLRARRPRLHRVTGRLYVGSVVLSGLAALVLAVTTEGRPVAALGFGTLAIFWLGTTGLALRAILAGRVEAHRRWMTRSYALTFGAVTLRLQLPLLLILYDYDYTPASLILAWSSWVPNLLVAEWLLRRPTRPAPALPA
ncbi:DUF2306 domain-containing protein [Pseudoroseicyclus tamaricis]|uniref:DUF2306 domain-containing protein n=1 Tax=Pseudoroseicyclus tamaricis TaxID=2705421 RepID=A0A6B2K1T3_9RHOB|nr:DUF2306 domain-containing protein [Pseudoroseicyclus tamaricis]NDV00346.1 DUF2306 domain-containing protein [Pseudoroseicyclus tamaricis]